MDAAIALLDRYPWHQFSPRRVHPEFQGKVWAAVRRQVGESAHYLGGLEDWENLALSGCR
jgi:hypothetical protein